MCHKQTDDGRVVHIIYHLYTDDLLWRNARSNFAEIFGIRKLESLDYRVVLFV